MSPTSRHGSMPKISIISSPWIGGWKQRRRSFSSSSSIFLRTRAKLESRRRTLSGFLDVMSHSHKIIRSSMSSPASKSTRRTAESVTTSSTRAIGRMCIPTSFCTYFILSLSGIFIFLKMRGIIFSPTKLWLWKVHPSFSSYFFVTGLPMSWSRAAQRSHSLSLF